MSARGARRGLAAAALVAAALATQSARAAGPCQRPADAGGYNGYTYGTAPVAHFDGAGVRIFYTTTGPHAVNPASTQPDMTPDNVVTAATVADAALASYVQMGFLPPISDNGAMGACGGDPRFDIYLMHFNAADGDAVQEGCQAVGKAEQCWAFALVEARLEKIYGTFELGAHVVIAHEIFHAVQNAYDASLDPFWSEGTAQWAAKTLYPAEKDLESFLPSFFASGGKSIDIAGGGVVADYLYGSAIWPVFLTEHIGPDVVRASFAQEASLGPPSMHAIDAALPAFGSSLADAYPTFAAWNAATGSRAGTSGYANAKSYPQVALHPFPDTGTAMAIAAGYSVFFYAYDFGETPRELTLTADPARVAALTFPLVAGKADLDQLAALPKVVTGAGVLVVAGISSKKSDAPFTVTAAMPVDMPDAGTMDAGDLDAGAMDAAPPADAGPGTGAGGASGMGGAAGGGASGMGGGAGMGGAPTASAPAASGGGCGCELGGRTSPFASIVLLSALVAAAARRRRRAA